MIATLPYLYSANAAPDSADNKSPTLLATPMRRAV
jgi:hypothetical protein